MNNFALNKQDFPILSRDVNGVPLVYLDNAATSQKPIAVIQQISDFYSRHNANVHRGVHMLSEEATQLYENARKVVAHFVGPVATDEIIFTSGTTQSINIVVQGFVLPSLREGDEILCAISEHHSNLVPWQQAAISKGAKLSFINITPNGEFDFADFENKLNSRVRFIAVSHVSNVLGTVFPIKRICEKAKEFDAKVLVDGAQAIPHLAVNVNTLGCDFYVFSGHKMLGPMGIGVLWGKKNLLEKTLPQYFGGGMIDQVSLDSSTWAPVPERFEAGTPNVAGAIGLACAIEYLSRLGMSNITSHEAKIMEFLLPELLKIPGLSILGTKIAKDRVGLVSFVIQGLHSHDIASVLDTVGVAVRSGHHCTMPLHKALNVNSSVRASFYFYNSLEDAQRLLDGVNKAIKVLKG